MWHSAVRRLIPTFQKGPAAIITYWAHMTFSFIQKVLSFIGFGHVVRHDPSTTDTRSHELKQLKLTFQQNNVGYDKQKWVTFIYEYYSPLFRKVTNVFQDSSLQIAFKLTNTVSHLTKERDNTQWIKKRKWSLQTNLSYMWIGIYRLSQEECARLREGVPYVKIYRYNPKHLCPKLNSYGDKGARKVWSPCGSTYCTWFAWRKTHALRIVRPCLQPAQARSSLWLHM